jgi:hypothetical protein
VKNFGNRVEYTERFGSDFRADAVAGEGGDLQGSSHKCKTIIEIETGSSLCGAGVLAREVLLESRPVPVPLATGKLLLL